MRRELAVGLLLATVVALQAALFGRLAVFGVTPDLVLVVAISVALLEGSIAGGLSGFVGGMLRDLLLAAPKGLSGLVYLLVGYGIGSIRSPGLPSGIIAPMVGVFIGSVVGNAFYVVLMALLGQPLGTASRISLGVALAGLYNAALTPLVHPVVRKVLGLFSREVVLR